jgi:hypothetical protein
MLRKITWLVYLVAITFTATNLFGQPAENHEADNCPEEKIMVHLSHASAFTGETVWFKIYCSSPLFPEMEISNLAFIELIGNENTSIIRKKVMLLYGQGLGEFEIPAGLSTGLYYIQAYTNWMKNFGEKSFFKMEFAIINPYDPYNLSGSAEFTKLPETTGIAGLNDSALHLTPDRNKYLPRDPVTIRIETHGLPSQDLPVDYSVSVFRKEPGMIFNTGKYQEEKANQLPEKIDFLPDQMGMILSGKLSDPSGKSISGAQVTASAPGSGTWIESSLTDENGSFHFRLAMETGEKDVVLTLPSPELKVGLDESFWNGFRDPPDNLAFALDQQAIAYLKQKFEHYQLSDRFRKRNYIKIQLADHPTDSSVFYSKPYQVIKLSNYIRLDSLREYFHELVPSVKFNQRRGEIDIQVIDPHAMTYNEDKPGVFLDGVLYDNYAAIAALPVEDVDRISIIPNTYYYKDFTFGGIIDIHTRKSDFNSISSLPNMTRFLYPMAGRSEREFTAPDYERTDSLKRIPDFRYLLHWEPTVLSNPEGKSKVRFFCSDVTGCFVVKVTGITKAGEILEAEKQICVEEQPK